MYKNEIKNLYSQKKESYKIIISDLTYLYFKLKIGYPNLKNEQNNIKYLIKFYISYDKNEKEILKEINNLFGNINYNTILEEILDELDILYEYYYNYIDNIISSYESIIDNNIIDILINRINGKYLKSDKYRYRLAMPVITKSLNKEKILEKIRSI